MSASDLSVAILRNDIDLMINAYGAVRQNVIEKQLRPIAATTAGRSAFLPDVPTLQEAGLAGFDVSSWNGIYAPAGTPAPVIERLAREIQAVLAEPDPAKRLLDRGVEVWPAKAEDLAARMTSDIARWNRVVDEAGIERQ